MKKCTSIKNRVLLLCVGLLFSMSAFAQSFTATGTVIDDAGIPVIGASVLEVGTLNGVSTDIDGTFTINVAKEGAMLEISLIGSQTKQVPAAAVMSIELAYDAVLLEDVVVVGFGVQKKENLTGAVGSVDSEVFESRPVQNAVEALQGTISGLNISNTSGPLGVSQNINIRGTATIGEGSSGSPLILIDGMEADLTSINPQDIESISVLKDAAASSIYGSRAPFGVILVTTKKGETGKVTVNYNNTFRYSTLIRNMESMDSYTAVLYLNDCYTNAGKAKQYDDDQIQRILDFQAGKITTTTIEDPNTPGVWSTTYGNDNIDYYDAFYKDSAFSQEHTISGSGGTEKAQIYASINYLYQEGFISYNENDYSRLATNLRATGKLSDIFSYSYNLKFNTTTANRATSLNDAYFSKINTYPFSPYYDPNGNLINGTAINLSSGGYEYKISNFAQQFRVVATPIKDWNITAEINYNRKIIETYRYSSKLYTYGVDGDPIQTGAGLTAVNEIFENTHFLNPNVYTDYSLSINDKHNFKAMLGFQAESSNYNNINAKSYGIISESVIALSATSGLDGYGAERSSEAYGTSVDWATAGFFGRLNYDYNGKYLLEANLRYDGTSRFRSDTRWGLFPSFSLGWNVAKEEFWSGIKDKINVLKLRASYGELGNQNTDNYYPTYQTLSVTQNSSQWLIDGSQQSVTSTPSLINSQLTWETITTLNFGLDFQALNGRISGSAEWYNRKTLNMVGPAPQLPDILGTDVPTENNTDLQTSGWEISLTYNDVTDFDLGYTIGLQLSDSKTKILSYPNLTNSLSFDGYNGETSTYYSGQTLGDIYGYTTIGIAKTDAEMQAHLATLPNGGQTAIEDGTTGWTAGDIMYADINGDGKIDSGSSTVGDTGDLSVIGNNTPRYLFGLNLAADYKGFDIRVFFQGTMKRDYAINYQTFFGSNASSPYVLTQHEDYFRDDPDHPLGLNLDSYYPRPVLNNQKNAQIQTKYLLDASYIRLKNLQIGYTFDKSVINRWGLSNLRLYVSGENLWTGTKLPEMFDPELIDTYDWGTSYPLQSTLSCGLSVTF